MGVTTAMVVTKKKKFFLILPAASPRGLDPSDGSQLGHESGQMS